MRKLSHFNKSGEAHMVDVSSKEITTRTATAKGKVLMGAEALKLTLDGNSKKGDILAIARTAGILAAKKTSSLIPLCHQLNLSKVSIGLEIDTNEKSVLIESTVKNSGQTGVEMEALTSVAITALTIYDMLKSVDKKLQINDIYLEKKEGGKSGLFINKKQ